MLESSFEAVVDNIPRKSPPLQILYKILRSNEMCVWTLLHLNTKCVFRLSNWGTITADLHQKRQSKFWFLFSFSPNCSYFTVSQCDSFINQV